MNDVICDLAPNVCIYRLHVLRRNNSKGLGIQV
jgi:hypothetical protein